MSNGLDPNDWLYRLTPADWVKNCNVEGCHAGTTNCPLCYRPCHEQVWKHSPSETKDEVEHTATHAHYIRDALKDKARNYNHIISVRKVNKKCFETTYTLAHPEYLPPDLRRVYRRRRGPRI